jgi:hypothetical protein
VWVRGSWGAVPEHIVTVTEDGEIEVSGVLEDEFLLVFLSGISFRYVPPPEEPEE